MKKMIIAGVIVLSLMSGCSSVTTGTTSNEEGITLEEFNALKDGMSYEEVVKIVGGPGELQAESGTPGDELHTVSYMYEGEGGTLGANANLMFQGDKLNMKAQAGLK